MTSVDVTINGKRCACSPEWTLLEAARSIGVTVPTLCHDDRLTPSPSCSVCFVEVRHGSDSNWRLKPACSTRVDGDGLAFRTDSPEVERTRRWALELLLSDHYADCVAPCVLACPAHVDVPAYIAAVRRDDFAEAVDIVRQTNPFPAVCGRVCFHRCEASCRRNQVDEPVAINHLKRRATEACLAEDAVRVAEATPVTGKNVAVVGAGPAGLTAAYVLRMLGHAVTVFDAQPEPGGMLRYGIPSFRLPRDILQADIDAIRRVGVELVMEQRLGSDFTLGELLTAGHDAIFVALGAWRERALGIEGEKAHGVLRGVDLLRAVNSGHDVTLNGRVGVVGGGNTAIDVARTAVRLGAEEVTIFYRRGRAEMPAHEHEVETALSEGIKLEVLVSPARIETASDRVAGLSLQRMELGPEDASGRAKPVPIAGDVFSQPLEYVIAAIGEMADLTVFEGESDDRVDSPPYMVDTATMQSGVSQIFAGGDFISGPSSAIDAIAAGRRAAQSIDRFLRTGEAYRPVAPIYSRRDRLSLEVGEACAGIARHSRTQTSQRPAQERRVDFEEVELGLSATLAAREAERCLQCTCTTFDGCELRHLMESVRVDPARLRGEAHRYSLAPLRPGIELDMNKCIRCTRCERICRELAGVDAIGWVYRGFDTRLIFAPHPDEKTLQSCDQCLRRGALCVDTCPTGALEIVDATAVVARQQDQPQPRQ